MTRQADVESLLKQLQTRRQHLEILLAQQAKFGLHAPPHITLDIQHDREAIQQCKNDLRTLGATVDDRWNDTEHSAQQPPTSAGSQLDWPAAHQALDMRDVLQEFRRGHVVLIVGHGLSEEAGLPSTTELRDRLADHLATAIPPDTGIFEIAQLVADAQGRSKVVSELQAQLDTASLHARHAATGYDLVAALVAAELAQICITLTWDDLLVSTLQHKFGGQLHMIRPGEQLANLQQHKRAVLRLAGDIVHDPGQSVLTISEVEKFAEELKHPSAEANTLRSIFDDQIPVFVGCKPDAMARALLSSAIIDVADRRPFAICSSEADRAAWRAMGCRTIVLEPRAFLEHIFWQTCQFINRSYELQTIFHPTTHPMVHLVGCAGVGKTDLLHEVCRRYAHLPVHWRQAFIDLQRSDDHPQYTDTLDIAIDILIKAEQRRGATIASERQQRFSDTETDTDRMAAVLNEIVRIGRKTNLLIVFDSFDMAGVPGLTHWMVSTFVPALRAADLLANRVRILIASRYTIAWNSFAFTSGLTHIVLSPFSAKSIHEMLQTWATLKVQHLPKQIADRIVAHVEELTQGHPAAIKNVLTELAEQSFHPELGPPEAQNLFRREEQRLFRQHVAPVIERFFERDIPLNEGLGSIIRILAVSRRFNPSFLPSLCAAELSTEEFPQPIHPTQIVAELQRHYMVVDDPNDQALCYKLDDLIRRLLASKLAIEQPARFAELCDAAFKLYDQTLRALLNDDMPASIVSEEMINSLMNESLFQALQLAAQRKRLGAADSDQLGTSLRDLLAEYIAIFERCQRIVPKERARQQIRRTLLSDTQFVQVLLPIQQFVSAP
jgi:hypothetical protein